jgi:hypothetical protein
LEIWNPGALPMGWTTLKLKQLHTSVPANPLLAEPLYLAGYIERMGTGTSDIVEKSLAAGLIEPQFIQSEDFRSIIFRPGTPEAIPEAIPEVTPEAIPEAMPEIRKLILVLDGEKTRAELQQLLQLKDEKNFRENYVYPALKLLFIEYTLPDTPTHPEQKYRLTSSGIKLKKGLNILMKQETPKETIQATDQVRGKLSTSTEELPQEFRSSSVAVQNLVLVLDGEMNRIDIQEKLELSHEGNFRDGYLVPALNEGVIEMIFLQKNHPKQKYRLTAKGAKLKEQLKKKD